MKTKVSQHTGAGVEAVLPRWMIAVCLSILCVFIAVPVAYVVLSSFASDVDIAAGNLWPTSWNSRNFIDIWSTVNLAGGLWNSVLVAGSVALVSSLVALFTAFILVRYKFVGRITILRGLVGLQSVPGTLLLLPVFVMFSTATAATNLQIIGTPGGLFITYLTFALPFSTWVMVTYLRGLPSELEEAARIDGASTMRLMRSIVLPLSWPGLIVSGIFAFLLGWNDVMYASIMTEPSTRTVAVVLQVFGSAAEGGALPPFGQMMASSLVCALPVVLLYLFFQRYLVAGLTAGGVK